MSSCVFIIQCPALSWAWDISTGIMSVYRSGYRTDPRHLSLHSRFRLVDVDVSDRIRTKQINIESQNLRCALYNLHNVGTVLPTPSIFNIAYSLLLALKTLTQDQDQATPSTDGLAGDGSYLSWPMSFVVPFGGYNTCILYYQWMHTSRVLKKAS